MLTENPVQLELNKIRQVKADLETKIQRAELSGDERESLKKIRVFPPVNLDLLNRWQILNLLSRVEFVGKMIIAELEGQVFDPEELEVKEDVSKPGVIKPIAGITKKESAGALITEEEIEGIETSKNS